MVRAGLVRLTIMQPDSAAPSVKHEEYSAYPYAELHCHSAFSLLDGASLPEAMVERARELGYHALALTDHNELGGAVRFAESCREHTLSGIVGAELTVNMPRLDGRRGNRSTHLVLLAETREGYRNISTLITRARMDSGRGQPCVPWPLVAQHAAGITALTGGPRGWIPQLLAEGRDDDAWTAATELHAVFGEHLAFECHDHRLAEERALVTALRALAARLQVPWVVTNDVRYAVAGQRIIHDTLCSLRHGSTLDEMGMRLRPNAEWLLKDRRLIYRRWRGAEEGLLATVRIADRCTFRMSDLRSTMPPFPVPPGMSADDYLAELAYTGASERWGSTLTDAQSEQLQHELAFIRGKGYAGFFLTVWGIVRYARSEGILCQGRGSAASSAVCYCLGITAVDPIYFGLLFERFLSEGRHEAPDIDIDIAHRDRERVLQYVYNRYGREHAAMVCEQITWRGRSAARDAARVLGFSLEQGNVLAAMSDKHSAANTASQFETTDGQAQLKSRGFDTDDPRVRQLSPIIRGLHELPRHRSIHVGGFILSNEPLGSLVPIEPASMPDRSVIQWEKDDLGPMGMFKVDLLGLGILTVVQDCLLYIRHSKGESIDLARLSMDDPVVYDDMCRADTVGVFQIESRAQMSTLPRLRPRCFYDLVVEVALVRPGPLQGQMVHPYLRRRAGLETVSYPHPWVKDVLERTLGVPLFQEQGMQVAIRLANFTAHQADELRQTMGHKRSRTRMARMEVQLREGMKQNGIDESTVDRICRQINGFADYGFPESHSASFALIVYATAWLRHYHPAEYLCAMLNAQPMGFYAPGTLIADAQRHGVQVRPIDLTRSAWDHSLELPDGRTLIPRNGVLYEGPHYGLPHEQDAAANAAANTASGVASAANTATATTAVRLGLRLIRNLGPTARRRLEAALADGPFSSLEDAVSRVSLDSRAWRALAESGALDGMFPHEPAARRRRVALWTVLAMTRDISSPLAPRRSGPPPVALAPCTPVELTEADYRMTGVSLSGHPMTHVRSLLEPNGVRSIRELLDSATDETHGRPVAVAGVVICRQRPPTAKGFMFVTLEDETGMVNIIITPDRFEANKEAIIGNPMLLIRGVLQVDRGAVNIRARSFSALHAESGERHVKRYDFR